MWPFKPNVQRMEERGDARGLVRALGNSDTSVREGARRALERLGAVALEPLVDGALWRPRAQVRQTAAELLQERGEPALEVLSAVLQRELGKSWDNLLSRDRIKGVMEAVSRFRGPHVVDVLWPALLAEQAVVRSDAVKLLGGTKDPSAVEALVASLSRADVLADTRALLVVATALGDIGDPRAVEPLLGLMVTARMDGRAYLCRAVEEALRRFTDPSVPQRIDEAWQAWGDRRMAARSSVSEGMSVKDLVRLLGEPDRKSDMGKLLKQSLTFAIIRGGDAAGLARKHENTWILTYEFPDGPLQVDVRGGRVVGFGARPSGMRQ
jgi:hypothetical protein